MRKISWPLASEESTSSGYASGLVIDAKLKDLTLELPLPPWKYEQRPLISPALTNRSVPACRTLARRVVAIARSLNLDATAINTPASTAMIVMTTRISTKVNPSVRNRV